MHFLISVKFGSAFEIVQNVVLFLISELIKSYYIVHPKLTYNLKL